MVKIAWKVINGYGPYAYLQKSVKTDGKVTSKHIAYLGAMGKKGLIPGKNTTVPPSANFEGGRLMVPFVGEETADDLKPGALAVVESLKSQVGAGLAKKDIVVPGKGKAASAQAAKSAPQKKGKKGEGKVAPNNTDTVPDVVPTAPAAHVQTKGPAVAPNQPSAMDKPGKGPAVAPNQPSAMDKPGKGPAVAPNQPSATDKPGKGPAVAPNQPLAMDKPGKGPAKADQALGAKLDVALKTETPPLDEDCEPLLSEAWTKGYDQGIAEVQQLGAAAATGDADLVDATAHLIAAKHTANPSIAESLKSQMQAISEGKGPGAVAPDTDAVSAAAPQWTQLSGPQGSTPGGLYGDQEGQKFYIKKPKSLQHVQNELLAQDLYKLAGVDVLESMETELEGAPAIASGWLDMTGSGTNPKGLPGTKEGFVTDAWLANWDSVGVGSTKYDNILDHVGKAVRVDLGGALLFRGTGGPKGGKFGRRRDRARGPPRSQH